MPYFKAFFVHKDSDGVSTAYRSVCQTILMISNATVKEFQEVIEQEFGVILDEVDANEILLNWVDYFDLLAKIDHRKEVTVS